MAAPYPDFYLTMAAGAHQMPTVLDDVRFAEGSPYPRHAVHDHESEMAMGSLAWLGVLSSPAGHSLPETALNWPPHLASQSPMPRESSAPRTHISTPMNNPPPNTFAIHPPTTLAPMAIPPYYRQSLQPPPPPPPAPSPPPEPARVREKRHSCAMCHKSFDRPSTLRKHLLVHTGEKAFACETCGRRFGVASNLNRHVRRCVLRPVHAATRATATDASPSDRAPSADSATVATSSSSHTSPAASPGISNPIPASVRATRAESTRPKRRRRAPSPAQWVPPSLLEFDLSVFKKSCPVPLAPSEWDPYDDQLPFNPYHPDGWKGRLPGPGRDIINTSMTVGRLMLC